MIVENFTRKTFTVKGVRVDTRNMADVADWCGGVITSDKDQPGRPYIRVDVQNPLTERQTHAYVGDWVLFAGRGFKVYTDRAFRQGFQSTGKKEDLSQKMPDGVEMTAVEEEPVNGFNPDNNIFESVPSTQPAFAKPTPPANPGGTHS